MVDRGEPIENHPMRGIVMNGSAVQSAYDADAGTAGNMRWCIYAGVDGLSVDFEVANDQKLLGRSGPIR